MATDRELAIWRDGFDAAVEATRIAAFFTKGQSQALNGMVKTLERTRDDFEAKWVARAELAELAEREASTR